MSARFLTPRQKPFAQRGFTLIEVLVVTAILGLFALSLLSFFENSWNQQRRQMLKYELNLVKGQVEGFISDPALWTAIINSGLNTSANFSCLQNGTDCAAQKPPTINRIFAIVDTSGNLTYNFTPGSNGFDYQGKPCNTFSNSGNDKCPFSYDLRWEPLCPAGACINPDLRITGTLLYKPQTQALGPMNPTHYNIDFIRYHNEGTLTGTCSAIGGTFDPVLQKCNLPVTLSSVCTAMGGIYNSTANSCTFIPSSSCPPGSVMTGTKADGSLLCDNKLAAGRCPTGQVSLGFNANGSLKCRTLSSITGSCPSSAYAVRGLNPDGTVNCVLYSSLVPTTPTPTPVPTPTPGSSSGTTVTTCTSNAGTFADGFSCWKLYCQTTPGSFAPPTGFYTYFICNKGVWNVSTGNSTGCKVPSYCPANF